MTKKWSCTFIETHYFFVKSKTKNNMKFSDMKLPNFSFFFVHRQKWEHFLRETVAKSWLKVENYTILMNFCAKKPTARWYNCNTFTKNPLDCWPHKKLNRMQCHLLCFWLICLFNNTNDGYFWFDQLLGDVMNWRSLEWILRLILCDKAKMHKKFSKKIKVVEKKKQTNDWF